MHIFEIIERIRYLCTIMEQNNPDSSKWSLAAKDGLILAAVTVVISTLTLLTRNAFLSSLLWLVKLVGSIWVLSVIMKRYGESHPDKPVFGYGALVCLLSALVCAVWAFVEYQFLFPGAVTEAFEMMYAQLGQMGTAVPDDVTDLLLRMEDNYAQLNCISTFIWCALFGLIVSAILSRSSRRRVFAEEEKQDDGGFNF